MIYIFSNINVTFLKHCIVQILIFGTPIVGNHILGTTLFEPLSLLIVRATRFFLFALLSSVIYFLFKLLFFGESTETETIFWFLFDVVLVAFYFEELADDEESSIYLLLFSFVL